MPRLSTASGSKRRVGNPENASALLKTTHALAPLFGVFRYLQVDTIAPQPWSRCAPTCMITVYTAHGSKFSFFRNMIGYMEALLSGE